MCVYIYRVNPEVGRAARPAPFDRPHAARAGGSPATAVGRHAGWA